MTEQNADNAANCSEAPIAALPEDQNVGETSETNTDIQLKKILCDVLGLDPDETAEFDEDTGLFGHLPELDSMAVAGLLTEMEDRLDIIIEDQDVDGEMLETYGGLLDFAKAKIAQE